MEVKRENEEVILESTSIYIETNKAMKEWVTKSRRAWSVWDAEDR